MNMGKRAKVLSLEQAIEWNREAVWIQTRDMACSLPAMYVMERAPFLRFRYKDIIGEIMYYMKSEYYGVTWRCFDTCPMYEEEYPWEDGGEAVWYFEAATEGEAE